MKRRTRKCLQAALPALLLCSPAVASSARSVSRLKGRNVAVQSEVSDDLTLQMAKKPGSDPFVVFGAPGKPVHDELVAAAGDVLDFLKNNDLLRANGEELSKISGDLDSKTSDLGRKEFAHLSPYSHCHAYGTHWNTVSWPTSNATQCSTAYGGVWETKTTAPLFQDASVSAKTATSFTVDVDISQSSTVYAVLVLATAPAPTSAQVKSGLDGSGAAAIQAKSQPVTVDPFTGAISFSGLDAGSKYLVYLIADNGSELTPTPKLIVPGFDSGLIYSSVSSWKFPKVRTDSNGDFYVMYWNKDTTKIQFDKWNGSSWDHYTSFGAPDVAGRDYVSYGNEYGANFEFDSNNNINVIFRASITVMANTSDPFHGVFNGSTWSFAQIIEDPDYAQDIRMFIDDNDKIYVVYHVGYTLKYRTNVGGTWTGQDIVTAGQIIPPGTSSGTDEIHDSYVVADSSGTVTIFYKREFGQNYSEDNYFMATSTDGFAAQTLVLDGKSEQKSYYMGNVIIDANDKIHYVYSNWTDLTGHYRTNASGSWVTTPLSSANYSITDGLDIQIVGPTTYILSNTDSGYFFQAQESGGSWVDGNLFDLNGWFSDKFGLDTLSSRIMLVSENSTDDAWPISYHTGEISDYVMAGGTPNAAPSLGGTFVTNGVVDDTATITTLFSGVTVSDTDGDNVSVSITYSAANGTLTGTGLSGLAGNYTLTSAAPATVQANLQGLVFHPTANQVAPGNTVVTTFTLTPYDGTENGTADASTQVTATSINDAPLNTAVPVISGTSTVGNQLSATSGTWTDADGDIPTYSYQWYRADDSGGSNEAAIPSATAGNYTLTSSDAHKFLRVVVTADDGNGSADQTASSTRTAVANTPPVNSALPAISGSNTVGNQLSATSGTWTDADGDTPTYSYQWYRADDSGGSNEAAIPSATSFNYTLTSSDAHKFLRVVVTANDGNGSADQTASSTRTAVANTAPLNTAVPVVSGSNTVGNQLSATSGTWTDADGDTPTYSYQWYRADDSGGSNEAAIPSATALNYTLTSSDAHKFLRVVVTANDGNGSADQTAGSTRTAVANTAPVNSVLPAISGTNTVGNELSSSSGTWTDVDGDTPSYSYQWYRADDSGGSNEVAIPSATALNYTLTISDAHKFLRVVVTANDNNGSADQTATSAWTAVANTGPVNSVLPAISGSNTVGNQLSATSGTWTDADDDSALTYSYQWYRADDSGGSNEEAIPSATALNYTLTASDAHKFLRVVVTADDNNGSADQTVSSTRTAIANTAPVNSVLPAISGSNTVGNELSVTSGTWTDTDGDTPTYTYQWYRADDSGGSNEAAIPSATALNYTLTSSDAHKFLRVVVTADDGNGSADQTATSTRTAVANTAPVNNVLPAISGIALVYNTLSTAPGTWIDVDGDPLTYTYQWKADSIAIDGEVFSNFILTPVQGHATITCTVTADDGNGEVTSATTLAAVVDNSDPSFTGTPTITGDVKVGRILGLADSDTYDADGDTVTLSYQWHIDSLDIAGATSSTYKVTADQVDKNISCTLTAVDDNGGSASYTTDAIVVTRFPWLDILPGLVYPHKVSGARQ